MEDAARQGGWGERPQLDKRAHALQSKMYIGYDLIQTKPLFYCLTVF